MRIMGGLMAGPGRTRDDFCADDRKRASARDKNKRLADLLTSQPWQDEEITWLERTEEDGDEGWAAWWT